MRPELRPGQHRMLRRTERLVTGRRAQSAPRNRPNPAQRHPQRDRQTDPGSQRPRLVQSRDPETADRRRDRRQPTRGRTRPARRAGKTEPTLAATVTSSLVRTVQSTHTHAGRSTSRRPAIPVPGVPSAGHRTSGLTPLSDAARLLTPQSNDVQVGAVRTVRQGRTRSPLASVRSTCCRQSPRLSSTSAHA